MSERALSILIHGESKAGKSTLAATSPTPMLFFDVEAAARFLKGRKIYWNPLDKDTLSPPEYDGTWDICVVVARDYETVLKTYDWLKSGKHPFKSVVLDSISELQVKVQESINGREKMKIQDWGELNQKLAFFCRDLRDLTADPFSPIEAVVLTAMSKKETDSKGRTFIRPFLQGQVVNQIPYWFDITSYLYVDEVADENGEAYRERFLYVESHPTITAGNRVGGVLGEQVVDPNISDMLDTVFGPADGEEYEEEVDEEYEDDVEYEEEETEE